MKLFDLFEAIHPAAQLVVSVVGMKVDSLRKALEANARHGITYTETKKPLASTFCVRGRQDLLLHLEELLAKHGFQCNTHSIFEALEEKQEFIRAVYDFAGRVDKNMEVDISPERDANSVHLSVLWNHGERKDGRGTTVMKMMCDLADRMGITIKLEARPLAHDLNAYDDDDSTYRSLAYYNSMNLDGVSLVRWYERFGFKKTDPNWEDDDAPDMVRIARRKNLSETKSLLIKHFTLKDGTPAKVRVQPSDLPDCYSVDCRVKLPTGKWIHVGSGHFGENDWDGSPGEWSAMQMHVNDQWKRKGVATAIYDAMEKAVGKVVPEPRYHKRSNDANAFWRARDPKLYGRW